MVSTLSRDHITELNKVQERQPPEFNVKSDPKLYGGYPETQPSEDIPTSTVSTTAKISLRKRRFYKPKNISDKLRSRARKIFLAIKHIKEFSIRQMSSLSISNLSRFAKINVCSKLMELTKSISEEETSNDLQSSIPKSFYPLGSSNSSVNTMLINSDRQSIPTVWLYIIKLIVPNTDQEELIGDLYEGITSLDKETGCFEQFQYTFSHCFATSLFGVHLRLYYLTEVRDRLLLALGNYIESSPLRNLKVTIGQPKCNFLSYKSSGNTSKEGKNHLGNVISHISHNDQVALVAALVFALIYLLCGPIFSASASILTHSHLYGLGILSSRSS